jgi:prepilin-type N-terminal cleavage/methylation domain-containing protein
MLKNIKKRSEGFTIIEVLIVLAIAGLILLVVFLAVPALQRSSRNTQIKGATASVLGAVTDFSSNNNGQLPTGIATAADGTVTVSGPAGTSPASAKIQAGFTATGSNAAAMPATTGTISVKLGFKCTGNAFSATATPRAFAAGYMIEGGSTPVAQCVES